MIFSDFFSEICLMLKWKYYCGISVSSASPVLRERHEQRLSSFNSSCSHKNCICFY